MPILELATLAFSGVLLYTLGSRIQLQRRLIEINKYLEEGRAREFIAKTTTELDRQTDDAIRTLLHMNLSAGFVFLGDFDVALATLRKIDTEKFKRWRKTDRRRFSALYYNNLLNALLYTKNFAEAVSVWSEHADDLVPKTGLAMLDHCLEGTAATYHYFCGDAQSAYSKLEQLSKQEGPSGVYRAKQLYLLGRLDLSQNRFEQGMARIEEAAKIANQSYIASEPKLLSIGEERVGAPGSGKILT